MGLGNKKELSDSSIDVSRSSWNDSGVSSMYRQEYM